MPFDPREYQFGNITIPQLITAAQRDFPGLPYHIRDHIGFLPQYVEWIRRGTKTCTIRFRSNELDLPAADILPIRETKTNDPNWRREIGEVTINRLVIKPFGSLDENDCIWDGFRYVSEVKQALQKVYGPIQMDQLVSIYWFQIKSWRL